MKWFNDYRMRLVLIVFVVAIVLSGGGNAKADFTFGTPTNLGPTVNSSTGDCITFISADGLEMYFDTQRSGGYGGWDIWLTTRETVNDEWNTPVNLGAPVNSSRGDFCSCLSADGLELYFGASNWPGGYGGNDICMTRRSTKDDPWTQPVNLGSTVNTSYYDCDPKISADGLMLFFTSDRPGGYGSEDIWVSRRATVDDPWGEPMNLGPIVNSSASECYPFPSSDGLILLFSEDKNNPIRPGGIGNVDMWVTRRASVSGPWGTPVNLGPIVNSPYLDCAPVISPDGSTLYFCSERPGGFGGSYGDIYQAEIIPIVDLNGDGIVDSADMCIMVDHWGTDESLCDIGPTPLGDGIVDVQDLIVLAEHLFEEVKDPTLIAQWALDETEGDIAYDSAGVNDGTVYGEPAWQPTGGMLNGALQLDGVDDRVVTSFILDPADGPFSVFAWIKGGASGQAVLSQISGVNWLCADTLEGNLMTELKATSRGAAALLSQTIVTDGDWHRIGLVWDGSNRTLYVDDVAVVEDTQANLEGSDNGLYIGTGKAMESGTYWSGLIDDVRIYNRALRP